MDSGNISAIISAVAGISGVLLGNSFVTIKELLMTRIKTKKEAYYLGALVVSHLERFATGCLYVALDDGTQEGRPAGDGEYHAQTVVAPDFKPLEIDVDWKVLPKALMYEILHLPDERAQILSQLSGIYEYDDPPEYTEYFWSRRREFAELGLKVSKIAQRLRKHVDIPVLEVPEDEEWTRDKQLLKTIEEIDAKRAAYEKRLQEAFAKQVPPPIPVKPA